jgi:hypothetical protein
MPMVFFLIYVNAIDEELINEAKGCLSNSQITASTYNGRAVYSKYNITISIPLRSAETNAAEALCAEIVQSNVKQLTELDSLVYKKYNNPEFESHLNIPFA